jgi:hypothetical protein
MKNINLGKKTGREKIANVYTGLVIASIALGNITSLTVDDQLEEIQNAIEKNSENREQFMSAWEFVEKFIQLSSNTERLM